MSEQESPEGTVGQCELLGGAYALFLQGLIGVMALSSLLYKRAVLDEVPRRPFNIWFMDVSKQCFSSVVVHFWNVGLSILLSQQTLAEIQNGAPEIGDQCANYLINFIMDTVLGVFLVWILLKFSSYIAYYFDIASLKEQGFYDDPPSSWFYAMQLSVFLLITLVSKLILGLLFISFELEFDKIGALICLPFKENPAAELTFVMVVCPTFLNIIQYWIQDNILMDGRKSEPEYVLVGDRRAKDRGGDGGIFEPLP